MSLDAFVSPRRTDVDASRILDTGSLSRSYFAVLEASVFALHLGDWP